MLFSIITRLNELGDGFIALIQKEILYSSALFLLIAPIAFFTKKRSAYWQFGLWSLLLIRLILPPDLSHALSGRQIMDAFLKPRLHILHTMTPNLFSENSTDTALRSDPISLDSGQMTNTSHQKFVQIPRLHWKAHLLIIWIFGFLTFFIIYLKTFMKIRKWTKSASITEDISTQKVIHKWKSIFHIKRSICLFTSSKCHMPFTTGIISPKIFIPEKTYQTININLLESIIAHEMAHIKRLDALWIKLQNFIQLIYFFHPVAWITCSRLHLYRECICDNMVLRDQSISSEVYSKDLISILKSWFIDSPETGILASFGSPMTKLKIRINNLKKGDI